MFLVTHLSSLPDVSLFSFHFSFVALSLRHNCITLYRMISACLLSTLNMLLFTVLCFLPSFNFFRLFFCSKFYEPSRCSISTQVKTVLRFSLYNMTDYFSSLLFFHIFWKPIYRFLSLFFHYITF